MGYFRLEYLFLRLYVFIVVRNIERVTKLHHLREFFFLHLNLIHSAKVLRMTGKTVLYSFGEWLVG